MFQFILSSRADGMKVLLIVCFALSFTFVSLRIFVRGRMIKNFGADDCFLLATLASFTVYTVLVFLSLLSGIGSLPHQITDPYTLSHTLYLYYLTTLLHPLTITLLRLTCALHLLTLSQTRAQRYTICCIAAIAVLCNTGYLVLVLGQCSPISYFWTGWIGAQGVFMDAGFVARGSYVFAGVGAGVDWLLVFASVWVVWGGEMSSRAKNWGRVVLIVGLCAGAAALIRIPMTRLLLDTDDFFYDCVPILIGSVLEVTLGMVAISAATFRPFFRSYFEVKGMPGPIPLMLPRMEEKRSLESLHERNSSLVTGAHVPVRNTVFRKVSEDRSGNVF